VSQPSNVFFHSEETDFNLPNQPVIIDWINKTAEQEDQTVQVLNFIFCSDKYLHQINVEYLNHDTYTDVITFPYMENGKPVEGDIFISVERIKENAENFKTTFENELHRVMIHGTLHLLGYGDKSPEEKSKMTEKENEYLVVLNGMKLDKS